MLSMLATSYRALGSLEKAERCWRRILSRCEIRYGKKHPETAKATFALANFLSHVGRFEDALAILERTLQTLSEFSGPDDELLKKVKGSIPHVKLAIEGRRETERWPTLMEWPLAPVTDTATQITLRLPATWELLQSGNVSNYRDLRVPQYNFLISARRADLTSDAPPFPVEIARSFLRANPDAYSAEIYNVGTNRAVAHYLTTQQEPHGNRKADQHWFVLETGRGIVNIAIMTLSILADMAREEETDALTLMLGKEIENLKFGSSSDAQP